MFVIGETRGKVINGKLSLPKEYHLKKRDILAKWKGDNKLYLSDSVKSLQFATGSYSPAFTIHVDSEDRIEVPTHFENADVRIEGCISTIEISFIRNEEY